MRRRTFIQSVAALGVASALDRRTSLGMSTAAAATPALGVKRVLAMFKCHFDAGFVNTQAAVVHQYFAEYFPRAIQTAGHLRRSGNRRYVWTTGSWLLYEYLEQALPEERRQMEQAILRGDIAWHAIPFSWQTELMDASMISGSIALSHSLDRRFGRTTTGAKMTDVPGHTRGLIRPLTAEGVKFLHIGVNHASTPAEVPALFLWKDSRGNNMHDASLLVLYHHDYGGVTQIPGSDLAVAIVVKGDNKGPHTLEEIATIYSDLSHQFPNAEIVAASLTDIANAVEPYRRQFPVVTQEIGDSWIYGVSSDPLKLSRYREVSRLRQSWIDQESFRVGDATDIALLRRLLLEAEHTWGADTKTWLDFDHYTSSDLTTMLNTKNYKVMEFSWAEKRKDLFDGIATLPAPLVKQAQEAVQSLEAKEPKLLHGRAYPAGKEIETAHFILKLDPATGAIHRLLNKKSGREWANADHPLALFSYQTLSQQDYSRFFSNYLTSFTPGPMRDFGKPNLEHFGAESRDWLPSLVDLRGEEDREGHHLLARLEIHDPVALQSGRTAFPQRMYMELRLPHSEAAVHLNFYWFEKPATRLPEAIWLSFDPAVSDPHGWMLEKTGEQVSPFDVVTSGGRGMHAVSKGFCCRDKNEMFTVETLDAPLIALGVKSPLNFSKLQPDLSHGVHCNLFNNAWGTNYIQWFAEDMRFRFILRG